MVYRSTEIKLLKPQTKFVVNVLCVLTLDHE
jgi:hypothetical protein